MQKRLVVSTECPTCAAPLDFQEGSNAVRCEYCRSNLLVTGRKQVLSYYVEPKIEPRTAARNAWVAARERGWRCRAVRWERYFVPYYRLVGHDLRWERNQPEPRLHDQTEESDLRLTYSAINLAVTAGLATAAPSALKNLSEEGGGGTLRDRYVDKNFLAADLKDAGLYSLGVRLSVLKLRLFSSAAVGGLGHVVAPTLAPDAALTQGMNTVALEAGILQRKVIGRVLSVVYYPLCVVELERGDKNLLGIVDGVSGSVARLGAQPSLCEALQRRPTGEPPCVGFRPLACPNCGWDLPVEADFVIFFCSSCERAWEIVASDLHRVAHTIADVPTPAGADASAPARFLPFWVLESAERDQGPTRFYVPAFRYRRLKILVDLARDMSGKERTYTSYQGKTPALHGCYYDQEDAVSLAEVTYPGLSSFPERTIERLRDDPLSLSGASLTWFPFRPEANSLRDPFTRRAISKRLLG